MATGVKVGQTVLVKVDPRQNNGADEAPAMITRVLDTNDDEQRVNLRVFLDGDEELNLRNVVYEAKRPENGDSDTPKNVAFRA